MEITCRTELQNKNSRKVSARELAHKHYQCEVEERLEILHASKAIP